MSRGMAAEFIEEKNKPVDGRIAFYGYASLLDIDILKVYFLYMPRFEWDPEKSETNKDKHCISFREATEIWRGIHLTAEDFAISKDGEKRSATIGMVGHDIYIAIWTKRNKSLRIISVRRARNGEKRAFLKKFQKRK
jgi:uncharacterized protein